MLKINLETELLKQNDESIEQDDLIISEVTKILAENEIEQDELLSSAGLEHNIVNANAINARKAKVESFGTRRVFSENQIKSLCVKYGLRFLPTVYYKGTIHPETHIKIKEFNQEFNEELTRYGEKRMKYRHYFIVAPKQAFKLEKRPKDPLLFIHIGGDDYYLIHKWGDDLSSSRYLTNIPFRSGLHTRMSFLVLFITLTVPMFLTGSDVMIFTLICADILLFILLMVWGLSCDDILANEGGTPIFSDNKDEWNKSYE